MSNESRHTEFKPNFNEDVIETPVAFEITGRTIQRTEIPEYPKEPVIKVGINLRNVKSNISKLKQKGFIERVSADKGGYWKVIKVLMQI